MIMLSIGRNTFKSKIWLFVILYDVFSVHEQVTFQLCGKRKPEFLSLFCDELVEPFWINDNIEFV